MVYIRKRYNLNKQRVPLVCMDNRQVYVKDVGDRVFLKRRPKNEDLRPNTLWSKTKTQWSKTKTLWSKTKTLCCHWHEARVPSTQGTEYEICINDHKIDDHELAVRWRVRNPLFRIQFNNKKHNNTNSSVTFCGNKKTPISAWTSLNFEKQTPVSQTKTLIFEKTNSDVRQK